MTLDIVPVTWDEAALTARTATWPDRAKALAIVDSATCVTASELLKGIKDLRKEIDDTFDGIIAKAFAAHRESCAQKKRHEAPLVEAEAILKRGLSAYETEQELRRREEQRRLQAQALKDAEDRLLAEAADLERVALAGPEPDIDALSEAHRLLEEPIDVPSVIVPKRTPTVSGVSYRELWRAEVTDLKALCRAIADGSQPVTLVTANASALNGLARSLKGAARVPGVKFVSERTVAASGR